MLLGNSLPTSSVMCVSTAEDPTAGRSLSRKVATAQALSRTESETTVRTQARYEWIACGSCCRRTLTA